MARVRFLTAFTAIVASSPALAQAGRLGGGGGSVDVSLTRIVSALVDWLHANAPKSAYVSLIADGPAKDLYAQYGFEPTAPASIGMAFRIK